MNSTLRTYGEDTSKYRAQYTMVLDKKLKDAVSELAKLQHTSMASIFREGAERMLAEYNYQTK